MTDETMCTCRKPRVHAITGDCVLCGLPRLHVMPKTPIAVTLPQATGDDPVHCAICGKETSLAMIATHLERDHGYDAAAIADAEVIDATGEAA